MKFFPFSFFFHFERTEEITKFGLSANNRIKRNFSQLNFAFMHRFSKNDDKEENGAVGDDENDSEQGINI